MLPPYLNLTPASSHQQELSAVLLHESRVRNLSSDLREGG